MKKKVLIIIALCLALIIIVSIIIICNRKQEAEFSDDVWAMATLLSDMHLEPLFEITDLKKNDTEELTIFYRVECNMQGDEGPEQIIFVLEYNREFHTAKRHYLAYIDESSSYHTMWNDSDNTIISFSDEEIEKLISDSEWLADLLFESKYK